MEATRPHLDRAHGDIETGFADVLQPRIEAQVQHAAPPMWLTNWESKRPILLTECVAEMIGVFIYTFFGLGSSAAFFLSTVAKEAGFGSLLTIGFAYGGGIVFALVAVCSTSGGHLSPSYTIAFAVFKGFPWRKVPFYLLAQILGAFLGALAVYGVYKQEFDQAYAGFKALGPAGEAAIFTAQGPAGVLGLFPGTTQTTNYLVAVEFLATLILSMIVFAVLDASNFLTSLASAPFIIGFAYSVVIWCFAIDSISLNSARDLGGRMACSVAFGSKCWTAWPKYTAIAALVNIPGTLCGCAIQVLLLSDSARKLLLHNVPPKMAEVARSHNERNGHSEYDATSMRVLTRDTQNIPVQYSNGKMD
ncbi:BZ3500_MvSof-1268-A1-R1_Chr9g10669 [Microbotryum saponariae]|uniref:BZ3500_MvSof-1268-A1-R1_Chr9g10669 protein n=1 Tax=Microbotryum saponariae TaxID=289078 RepID=A0A2X0KEL9_9BASI|nr:BZ3501_MvSof-1269-A2-R1_Chr9g10417 [Microbotryum saponariae]SDA00489.1 BZ3500_MvSof-1268-A1-R1_Chr9g10669 [Microbotryum saponariae]